MQPQYPAAQSSFVSDFEAFESQRDGNIQAECINACISGSFARDCACAIDFSQQGACPATEREYRQETDMSNSIKSVVALGFITLVAACGGNQQEEFVIIEPEPITVEPEYTGKYK